MPNSNLVSQMMMPRLAAYSAAAWYRAMAVSRTLAASSAPTISSQRAKLMFSSWSPTAALVDGVKIGSGSWLASCKPAGRVMPHTVPDCWYSFQPEPAR